ncbi:MAG: helix-turn-helix domain-containing protein [Clostridia bacterium]|nr:helix-turn-helix domain-containing protein [Clostridia bacterium]
MEEFNVILKKYREISKISLDELSKKTNIPKSTLSRYENNSEQKIDIGNFIKIAREVNVPSSVIENIWIKENALPFSDFQKIPVVGKVCAGNGIFAEENIIGYEVFDDKFCNGDYFCLQVSGDSMTPKLDSGDIVLVKRQNEVENGEVAIVMMDNEEGMIKKVISDDNSIRLVSFNPYYPDIKFEDKDVSRVRIIGKVIESKKKW